MSLLLSESERDFYRTSSLSNIRADGRSRLDYRNMKISQDILPQSFGSAQVLLEGEGTQVLAAIRADIIQDSKHKPNECIKYSCFVEAYSSGADDVTGEEVDALHWDTNDLNHWIEQSLQVLQPKERLLPNGYCWHLMIEAQILHYGGNLTDVLFRAVIEALKATKLPKVEIQPLSDKQMDYEFISDEQVMTSLPFDKFPLCLTMNIFGDQFLVDATLEEELCASSRWVFVMSGDGQLISADKIGSGEVEPTLLLEMVQASQQLVK